MSRLAVVRDDTVPLTLDHRIREILSAPDVATIDGVEVLIADVKQELQRLAAELRDAEQVVIDPVATQVAIANAGKLIETSGLTEKRLTATLDRLDHLHSTLIKEAGERKYREAYEAAELERDELARLLRTRYPALVGELVQLVSAITENDKRIKQFSGLRSVEHVVRGVIDGYYNTGRGMTGIGTLALSLRLPALSGSDEVAGRSAWPPASYRGWS